MAVGLALLAAVTTRDMIDAGGTAGSFGSAGNGLASGT
jgi:hypothetical protein